MSEKPTQQELATLAARLATGKEESRKDLDALAEKAITLWDIIGGKLIERNWEERGLRRRVESLEHRFGDLMTGDTISRNKMLAILMPKRKSADRLRVFRLFIDYWTETGGVSSESSTPVELAAELIEGFRVAGVQRMAFFHIVEEFDYWHESYSRRIASEAGRTASKKRTKQK